MLWYGARLVLAGQLTAGALVVFLLYLGKMYKPMRDLSKMTDTVSKAGVGFERIREVLETEGGVRDRRHARTAPAFKGAIEFDHVSFGYSPDQSILDDVSFAIEPGQVAAFVGPTGGGKTTIINLSRASTIRCPARSASTAPTSATFTIRVAARSDQLCAAGHAAVPCADLAEHRLRPARRDARRDRPRRRTRQRARVHQGDAGGLRHDGRRARRDAFRAASASASPSRAP